MKTRLPVLALLTALCLMLTGCVSYELSKAWRGGSKVPPPPLPVQPATPPKITTP